MPVVEEMIKSDKYEKVKAFMNDKNELVPKKNATHVKIGFFDKKGNFILTLNANIELANKLF